MLACRADYMGSAWCYLDCSTELHSKPAAKDIHLHLYESFASAGLQTPSLADTIMDVALLNYRNFLHWEHTISQVIPSRFLTSKLTSSTIH